MADQTGRAPVGVVGLGLMGTAFYKRLLAAGFPVVGFDVDAGRADMLRAAGGMAVASVKEVADRCDRIVVAVLNMKQTEDVAETIVAGRDAAAGPRIVLSTATVEPDGIAALAARVAPTGHAVLDTPASGTSLQVERGESLGLIAGDPKVISAVEAVLDAIYPRRRLVGDAGAGTMTKLAINLILGLNRIALAEGLVFAERMGLELATFLDVAKQSAAYSQVMDQKGTKMVTGDYKPISKVAPHLKDVRTMIREATRRDQQLPLATVLVDVLEACERNGDADADNAIMIEEIRRRRG